MAKYVLIPDSFKGTLSSEDICRIASEEILRLEPEAEICAIPVADGGEGTVDAFLAAVGGTRAEVPCSMATAFQRRARLPSSCTCTKTTCAPSAARMRVRLAETPPSASPRTTCTTVRLLPAAASMVR